MWDEEIGFLKISCKTRAYDLIIARKFDYQTTTVLYLQCRASDYDKEGQENWVKTYLQSFLWSKSFKK